MLAHPIQGVLCTGNLVYDLLVRPVDHMAWGTTTWVEELEQQLGGNGASTSYALARLGVPVRLIGLVGADGFGDLLVAKLEAAGVDTGHVGRSAAPTPATVALVNSKGERLFLHRPGSSGEALAEPIDFAEHVGPPGEGAGRFTHYHLANFCALPRMRPLAAEFLRRAKAAGMTTSLDTGWDSQGRWMEDLGPCLPFTDLLFVNEDEARLLSGGLAAEEAARYLEGQGAACVVVKLGGRGCFILFRGCGIHSPAFSVNALDTTGAGDCFVGGFLAALHHGQSLEDAARFANAVAALSVERLGAVAGLRSYRETTDWMAGR
jgi:sugar/nucleoside kinase (ribokinase family)